MPISFAAGVWVRNAKGGFPSSCLLFDVDEAFEGDAEGRCSRFGAVGGWRRAFNRAICASLRVFSATSAAFSFCVSMSLRRRV
jgi:hypothetical protein